ncbi:phage tail protein [Rahnella sp. AA]|uniref:phage tail protein n=1 Tax=Rahnella sp. AA TaxID=2057180 RepID=UPI000C3436E7|nr:phage tail protein [Rahnella sp. AA]PKE30954.1 phage tail protein [Rahnella sp. AA]
MAIDTFSWRVQGSPEGSYDWRTRSAQFDSGYKQVAGDGINPETQTWPLTFQGREKDITPILTFVRNHVTKSCVWTPPYGVAGLYRVTKDSIKANPIGGTAMSVSFTFEQAYSV